MSRLNFLLNYAEPDRHYSQADEVSKTLSVRGNAHYLYNKKLKPTPDVVDAIVDHISKPYENAHHIAQSRMFVVDHLQPHHIDKLLDSENVVANRFGAEHAISPENVDKALAKGGNDIMSYITNSPGITSEHLGRIIRSDKYDSRTKANVLNNPKISDADLEWASDVKNHGKEPLALSAKGAFNFRKEFNHTFKEQK